MYVAGTSVAASMSYGTDWGDVTGAGGGGARGRGSRGGGSHERGGRQKGRKGGDGAFGGQDGPAARGGKNDRRAASKGGSGGGGGGMGYNAVVPKFLQQYEPMLRHNRGGSSLQRSAHGDGEARRGLEDDPEEEAARERALAEYRERMLKGEGAAGDATEDAPVVVELLTSKEKKKRRA